MRSLAGGTQSGSSWKTGTEKTRPLLTEKMSLPEMVAINMRLNFWNNLDTVPDHAYWPRNGGNEHLF